MKTVAILGDVHGGLDALFDASQRAAAAGAVALIQVGDLGFSRHTLAKYHKRVAALPVYAIDGNHEDFTLVNAFPQDRVSVWFNNIHYVPRGTVLELGGRWIGFLGGAGSIDKDSRLRRGLPWYASEQIMDVHVATLLHNAGNRPLDLLITHCPPQRTITTHFETDPLRKVRMFGVSPDWSDPSATKVEQAWHHTGYPPLYCGHMHESVTDGDVRILNIDELVIV